MFFEIMQAPDDIALFLSDPDQNTNLIVQGNLQQSPTP